MIESDKEIKPVIKIIENENGRNRLAINSLGARIEELVLSGEKILTKVMRGDGKEASTHPCIPQFGRETITSFNLPQHGSARNKRFNLSDAGEIIKLSQDIEDEKYPKGLVFSQFHKLSKKEYSLITIASNKADLDLPVNFAEHFYWNTPNGWEGLRINGVDVTEIVKKDSNFKIELENEIIIPGQKPIILKQKGFSVFRLWAYKNPQSNEYDKNYVCIEPIEGDPSKNYFGSRESMIRSGRSRTAEIIFELNE